MKVYKQSLLLLPALVLAVSLFSAPVYARDGADDSTESTNSSSQESENEVETHAQEQAREQEREQAKDRAESLREQAKQEVEKKREDAKQKSEEFKKKRADKCESRKHGLGTKVENLNKNAQKHFERFNKVYANTLTYQKASGLNPAGLQELIAKADAAKAQAATSVDALNQLKPTLECQKDTVASDVSAFKTAAAQARADLQTYRQSVKDILKALEASKPVSTESEAQ